METLLCHVNFQLPIFGDQKTQKGYKIELRIGLSLNGNGKGMILMINGRSTAMTVTTIDIMSASLVLENRKLWYNIEPY